MRYLFTFLMVILTTWTSIAQITISQSDFPSDLLGMDSLRVSVFNSPLPTFAPATGAVWDLNMLNDSSVLLSRYRILSSSFDYLDSSSLGNIGNIRYQFENGQNLLMTHLNSEAKQIEHYGISLTSITAGPHDTLDIPSQTATYSAPVPVMLFPVAFGSHWNSNVFHDVQFTLTIEPLIYNTTCTERIYISRGDTVTGWGQMRINTLAGSPSDYFDVLQVRSVEYETDSFFTSGSPVSNTVLNMLGLSQGQKDTCYVQYYYRKGEVSPFAKVEFISANYSSVSRVYTHQQRLYKSVNVKDISYDQGTYLYPNPTSGTVHIVLPDMGVFDEYTIVDITGNTVCSGVVGTADKVLDLRLSNDVSAGTYFLELTNKQDHKMRRCTMVLQ